MIGYRFDAAQNENKNKNSSYHAIAAILRKYMHPRTLYSNSDFTRFYPEYVKLRVPFLMWMFFIWMLSLKEYETNNMTQTMGNTKKM